MQAHVMAFDTSANDEFTESFIHEAAVSVQDDVIILNVTEPAEAGVLNSDAAASEITSTVVFLVPEENQKDTVCDMIQNIKHAARAGGTNTVDDIDESLSVRGYLTLKYTVNEQSGGNTTYDLTGCSGKYTKTNNSISIDSQYLTIMVDGMGPDGLVGDNQQVIRTSVSGTSWSVEIPSSWKPVYDTGGYSHVLGDYTITMHRGTDSHQWSLTVHNGVL